MTTWFTSDPHFGHAKIIEYSRRPFRNVDHMNTVLVDNINDRCSPDDTLWIVGDVVMGKFTDNIEILSRLNPTLMMVGGNHDRIHPAHRSSDAMRDVHRKLYLRYFSAIAAQGIRRFALGGRDGPVVQVNHFPYEGDSQENDRFADMRPRDEGLPLIHGHVHTAWRTRGRQFNVGVDVNDYAPVHEDVLIEWVQTLE